MKKLLYILGIALLLALALPLSAAAKVEWNDDTISNDHYYSVISKADWQIAPGIWESEIVLNTAAGDRRQVVHIMEIDTNNPATRITAGYAEMNPDKHQTATVSEQATWVERNWGWNVVGAMNTALSWYNTEPYISEPHRKYESLGFMMVNGITLYDHSNGFQTCLVIHSLQNEAGEWLPWDIPRVELRNIYSEEDLNGFEEQVIPVSYGHWIVHDGMNAVKWYNHTNDVAPRSVVGVKPDGSVVLMMNDGRGYNNSTGMTMYECAEVMLAVGCDYAANCDGGGSSAFLSQRPGESLALHCVPSDWGMERENTNTILVTALTGSDVVPLPTRPEQPPTTTEDENDGWHTIATNPPTTEDENGGWHTIATNPTTGTVASSPTTTQAAPTTGRTTTAASSAAPTQQTSAPESTTAPTTGSVATPSTTRTTKPPTKSGTTATQKDVPAGAGGIQLLGVDWLVWAIGGGVAVLLLAGAIVFIVLWRKKQRENRWKPPKNTE